MILFENIQINKESSEPLFWQIMQQLRCIIEEQYPDTPCKMPSARKLSSYLKVDRSTVERAYFELKKAGLLVQSSPKILYSVKLDKQKYVKSPLCIGVILPDKMINMDNAYFQFVVEYLKGICDSSTQNNISLAMLQLPEVNSASAECAEFIKNVKHNYIGIIHLGEREIKLDSPLHKLMRCKEVSQVIISAETEYSNILQIVPNELCGAKKIADKCRNLALHNFGMVMPFDGIKPKLGNLYFSYTSLKRGEVLRDFFIKNNFSTNENYHIFNFTNYEELFVLFKEKATKNLLPDVYFCYNDTIANWLLEACKQLNIQVPEDLSIVGFDGINNLQQPNLTTIKLPFYEIGVKAVEVLVKQFYSKTKTSQREIKIDTDLVIVKTIGKKSI